MAVGLHPQLAHTLDCFDLVIKIADFQEIGLSPTCFINTSLPCGHLVFLKLALAGNIPYSTVAGMISPIELATRSLLFMASNAAFVTSQITSR